MSKQFLVALLVVPTALPKFCFLMQQNLCKHFTAHSNLSPTSIYSPCCSMVLTQQTQQVSAAGCSSKVVSLFPTSQGASSSSHRLNTCTSGGKTGQSLKVCKLGERLSIFVWPRGKLASGLQYNLHSTRDSWALVAARDVRLERWMDDGWMGRWMGDG